ncbi:GTP-binding protein [Suillus paluster]|uniref:GTP-binding protein n=1 Tax=Suillus paluster TaxID=48578 RepID=UPI001B882FB7|nr:GTP-binding protein [Suillus paluster]KAG1731661.1 GTP-binding protein [Suillus paluster]
MAPKVDPQNLRETFGRFRVLILGRANAGKTTILQKVCNTAENPEIYNAKGDKVWDIMHALMGAQRGNHDIRNEMVFKSNPGFVFHDSCGFEAGSAEEFEDMKRFISERANATKLEERIHAIWQVAPSRVWRSYCIPMDDHCRTIQRAEEKFFSECNTGNVPVIVIFTKFEALRPVAFGEIKKDLGGLSKEERSKRIAERVQELFKNTRVWDRLCELCDTENHARPKSYICLENMNRADTNCNTLLECTAFALDSEELKLCFVSTQQSNMELCIKYAVE